MKPTARTIILLITAAILSLNSCKKERDTIDAMFSGFMTGYTDTQGYLTLVKDDFGGEYLITGQTTKHKPDTLYRLVATLSVNDNGSASILQVVSPLSLKAPNDTLIHDSLKVRDPMQLNTVYIGGGYLNMTLSVKVKKEGTKHSLLYTYSSGSGMPVFNLYHNAYGDEQVYTKYAYVSIPLESFGLHKNDTVLISYRSYDEDCMLKVAY